MRDRDLRHNPAEVAGHAAMTKAAEYLLSERIAEAEQICREVLKQEPTNVNAMCMLADIGIRLGAIKDSENLLLRCLKLAPDYHQARSNYANLLFKQQKFDAALAQLDRLASEIRDNIAHELLRANIYIRIGRTEDALAIYKHAAKNWPPSASLQMSLGHTLKTLGKTDEAIAAYRHAATLNPQAGDSYWSLANLKTYRFTDTEIDAMGSAASAKKIGREDYLHLCFALGKALEDRGDFDEAFLHYRRGNAVRRRTIRYDADANHNDMKALQNFFTSKNLEKLQGHGHAAPDPIFIVGLPRAGSTLIEQILASHSQVEGTQELPDIIAIAHRLAGKKDPDDQSRYPNILGEMKPIELRALGQEYLDRTRLHRTGRPFFLDKMPNNFAHIGLIHLVLPNATVIDARRNPMDCCFSGYKQLFAKGQNFTYSLSDVGRYFRDYVELMRHWDTVLPGKVIRVNNEDMIADPEVGIRKLLDQCGLPFEPACLEFHRNERAVRTASSEQVRRPINASGVGRWRNFDKHLGLLKEALGNLIDGRNM